MAEIYRDTVGKFITFNVPGALVSKVEFYRNGDLVSEGTVTPAAIPYAITASDGEFTTRWTYTVESQEYTREEVNTVVTPLFSAAELTAFNDTFLTLSDSKIIELEKMIRSIIQAYTGQTFGLESSTVSILGSGGSLLMSNRKVVSVSNVSGYGLSAMYAYRPVKTGYAIAITSSSYDNLFPIIAPPTFSGGDVFRSGSMYTVTGTFGWVSVPEPVKQAALILAEMFSCREATWRDRYLKAVTAADWRFDFDGRAFRGTGSVTADSLLNEYIVGSMAIV